MNPLGAETYLRQQCDAELRRGAGRDRLDRIARALTAVRALDSAQTEQILRDFELALATRRGKPARQSSPAAPLRSPRCPPNPGRVVRVGHLIPVDDAGGEAFLLSYAQTACRGMLTFVARTPSGWFDFGDFAATDDKGRDHGLGMHGSGPGEAGLYFLQLHPDPPDDLRWLDFTAVPGHPPVRIDVTQPFDGQVTVSPASEEPGEHLLRVIGLRLLATAPPRQWNKPLDAAGLEIAVTASVDGLGDVIAALHAADALPPDSPLPGQLATLCERLSVTGHGIAVTSESDLPDQWRSVLVQSLHREQGRSIDPHGRSAAVVAALPQLDGARLTLLGLHDAGDHTVMAMHATGVRKQAKGRSDSGIEIWILDSLGNWHATRVMGGSEDMGGEVSWQLHVVPALSGEVGWIELHAADWTVRAAVRLPLHWELCLKRGTILAVMPVKWTERWIARAQRKADQRAKRFLLHQERVREGAESPGFLERLESRHTLAVERHFAPRYINADWPTDRHPYDASLHLVDAWLTWVENGPIRGPDDVEVAIWIRCGGQDLPFRYRAGDQAWLKRQQFSANHGSYTVCLRRIPVGHVQTIRSFAIETNARWYAIGLAMQVRQAGITALRPASIPVPNRRTPGLEDMTAEALVGVGIQVVNGVLWPARRTRAGWRRLRTGRR
jgi:hypothetical protein